MPLAGRKVKGGFSEEMKPELSLGDEPKFAKWKRKGKPSGRGRSR